MTLLTFILLLSILIVVHEFGHFIMARKLGVKVEKFSLGFGPKLFTRKIKDTEYSVSAIPLGGYVKLAGDSLEEYKGNPDEYCAQPPGKKFLIVFCGPLLNYILGILCFWLVFCVGYPKLTSKVGGLVDELGAKSAGLVKGDLITAVDGKNIVFWDELQMIIQDKKQNSSVAISYLRDNAPYSADVTIKEKKVSDIFGKKHSIGLIGIIPSDDTVMVRHGIVKSFSLSLQKAWDLTVITYGAIWRIVTGHLSMRESMAGPLRMFEITSKVVHLGVIAVINLLATISISLCLFNILPFPALDGGHMLLLSIEKIRGKGLGVKAEKFVSNLGFALLITLALVVTYNDILNMFGEKIIKLFK